MGIKKTSLSNRAFILDASRNFAPARAQVIETDHPNKKKYPNQRILIIDVEGYAYLVPCVINENECFLKTIIPSRKATKTYLGGKDD